MPELMLTLDAMHKVEHRKNKFMAAIQGINIDQDESAENKEEKNRPVTAEEVKARAVARLTGDMNLAGAVAEGFTPDTGLKYKIMEGTEIG